MSHEAYAPVGYAYQADQYCLDCIAGMFSQSSLGEAGCNCAECVLDRAAEDAAINRMDESSFDMADFPKHIPYHNELHLECGSEYSGDGEVHCGARCAACGDVIDGEFNLNGPDTCPTVDAELEAQAERNMS